MSIYIIPILFLFVFIYGHFKKVNLYSTFTNGAKGAIPLVISIFPYITAILIAVALLNASGITLFLTQILSPVFIFLGVPAQLCELILIRPFSGAGSFAIFENIITNYGANSYIAKCAAVILGCSETIFYVTTVYLSQTKIKKLLYAIPVSLLASIIGTIISCWLCKIM